MGDTIDLYPANGEYAYRFEFGFDTLEEVKIIDPLTFETREKPDHIHILVRSVPKLSPLQIVRVLKQQTNYWAWQNYETYLKTFYWKSLHLWTRGYFCSTVGNVSADTVHEYLEKQGRNEQC